ncbi:hypothetical protein J4216_04400 [Candidatus Woesearchaeota archaeon]|nr:hypothetical protein [Candidatus Woesearchaeota archaeon]
MNFKGRKEGVLSIILTVLIISILILSSPASAIDVTISNVSDTTPTAGDAVTWQITVALTHEGEALDISNGTQANFTVVLGSEGNCTYSMAGDQLSSSNSVCGNLTLSKVESITNTYNEGYNFGYGFTSEGASSRTNVSFGFGYGYGYDIGIDPNNQMTFNVTYNTTGLSAGDYEVDVFVTHDQNSVSSDFWSTDSSDTTLTVSAASSTTTTSSTTSSGSTTNRGAPPKQIIETNAYEPGSPDSANAGRGQTTGQEEGYEGLEGGQGVIGKDQDISRTGGLFGTTMGTTLGMLLVLLVILVAVGYIYWKKKGQNFKF